ncbi:hypothetical protein ACWEFL_27225 [Streptomyces sp. NPDC004838]
MSSLRITIAEGVAREAFDYTLATLPESYVVVPTHADVEVVDGGVGWVNAASRAIETGVRAVIVTDPVFVGSDAVLGLADRADAAGVLVRMAEQFAGNPALAAHERQLRAHLVATTAVVVTETRAEVPPADAALSVLRTLRALGLDAEFASWSGRLSSVHIGGDAGTVAIEAAVSRSRHAGQRIQALGWSRTVDIELPPAGTSTPARLTITTLDGEDKLASIYETADRAAWRATHESLESGHVDTAALRAFAADVTAVERLIARGSR